MNGWILKIIRGLGVVALLCAIYYLATWFSYDELEVIAREHRIYGALLLGAIMFSTTVLAPLTSLPLVPLVAPILGPFTTGLASYVGWVCGAVVAFWIGRHYGQPFVSRYLDMSVVRRYERYIPPDVSFLYITLLRMVIPVDIFSYALGLFTTVSLRLYTGATLVGLLWFSFAFAYAGDALMGGDYVLLVSIGVASVVILFFSWKYVRKILEGTRSK